MALASAASSSTTRIRMDDFGKGGFPRTGPGESSPSPSLLLLLFLFLLVFLLLRLRISGDSAHAVDLDLQDLPVAQDLDVHFGLAVLDLRFRLEGQSGGLLESGFDRLRERDLEGLRHRGLVLVLVLL